MTYRWPLTSNRPVLPLWTNSVLSDGSKQGDQIRQEAATSPAQENAERGIVPAPHVEFPVAGRAGLQGIMKSHWPPPLMAA